MPINVVGDGLEFYLYIEGRRIKVFVHASALEDSDDDHMKKGLDRTEYANVFFKHRLYFEGLAREKYLSGEVERDGIVKITRSDTARFHQPG